MSIGVCNVNFQWSWYEDTQFSINNVIFGYYMLNVFFFSTELGLEFSPFTSGAVKINYVRCTFAMIAFIIGVTSYINGFLESLQTNFTNSFGSLSFSLASIFVRKFSSVGSYFYGLYMVKICLYLITDSHKLFMCFVAAQ